MVESNEQKGPRLDLEPTDHDGTGITLCIAHCDRIAGLEFTQILGGIIRHEHVGMDGTRIDSKGARWNELAVQCLTVDQSHRGSGRSDEQPFTNLEHRGQIDAGAVADPSILDRDDLDFDEFCTMLIKLKGMKRARRLTTENSTVAELREEGDDKYSSR